MKQRKEAKKVQLVWKFIPCITLKLNGEAVQPRMVSSSLNALGDQSECEEVPEGYSDEEDTTLPPNDIQDLVTRVLKDSHSSQQKVSENEEDEDDAAMDDEDAPDWVFEAHEVWSGDPTYEFCPAAHHKQLLTMFT